MGLNELMPPGLVDYRSQDDWMLIYFNDAVEADLGSGLSHVQAGSLVAWWPQDQHRYGNPSGAWLHSWLHAAGREVEPILDRAGLGRLAPMRLDRPQLIEDYMGRMSAEMSLHARPEMRILRNLFESLLLEAARAVGEARAGRPPPTSLQHLKRHIDSRRGGRLSLEEMARIACMSPSHLSAEFKRAYGVSPVRYQIRRSMDEARHLLQSRRLSVSETAAALGYPDIFHFSRMFKRVTGSSPSSVAWKGA
jgi:AraC-like DNA-binding protein